jgi:CheY-like chemotaxis protein
MTRVLVVEDNLINAELVLEILKSENFNVDLTDKGEDAIKKAEETIYDLILMDIGLPGIDGTETANTIRIKNEYKKIPIIALTAFAMKGDKEKLLACGFDDYIPKPIDISEFISKIQRYKK